MNPVLETFKGMTKDAQARLIEAMPKRSTHNKKQLQRFEKYRELRGRRKGYAEGQYASTDNPDPDKA